MRPRLQNGHTSFVIIKIRIEDRSHPDMVPMRSDKFKMTKKMSG